MPVTQITNKATNQLKFGAGYVKQIYVANAGTTWTLQLVDAGQGFNNSGFGLLGATAVTIPAAGTFMLTQPLYFGNGLQVITAGTTAGEIDVDWF